MSEYNPIVITAAGRALISKVTAGECSTVFTRIATGNGSYTANEDVSNATALKSEMQSFTPNLIESDAVDTAHLQFILSTVNEDNTQLQNGYYLKEIGVFATDPQAGEILYAIVTAKLNMWDWIPPYNGSKPWIATGDIYVVVSTNGEVEISESEDAYASQQALNQTNQHIGSIGSLNTTNKSSVVNAINEVNTLALTIGDIANLDTDDKLSAVGAINELAGRTPYIVTKHNNADVSLQEDSTVVLSPFTYTATCRCVVVAVCGFYITGGSEGKDLFMAGSHRRVSKDSDGRIAVNCAHVKQLDNGEIFEISLITGADNLVLEGGNAERYFNVYYMVFPISQATGSDD